MNYVEWNNLYENTEKLLHDVFDALYFQILLDTDGRIVYINQIYADFFGMKKQDIIGMKIEELIPNTKLYEALQTGEAKYDQLFETVDDRKVLYNCLPIKNGYGEILGVATASSLNTALQIENLQERIERLEESNILLNRQLHGFNQAPEIFESIIGISDKIIELKKILSRICNTPTPILLTGESGTGKEVFATAIHNASDRKNGPFIKINCAAIPSTLVESELFGYETGTFSGAIKGGKAGKFEQANHGTILLDEIEELPLEAQSKLLRVLQEYEVERIGSVQPIPLDIHVICCSNQDLYQMVKEKKFREDLLYRINVIELEIPPLRDRMEDIPLLCQSLIHRINEKYHLQIKNVSKSALQYLSTYSWPGNVRELGHAIERACIMSDSTTLTKQDFDFLKKKFHIQQIHENALSTDSTLTASASTASSASSVMPSESNSLFSKKEEYEKQEIQNALKKCAGNKTKAAKELGISRSLLYDKIAKYGIN